MALGFTIETQYPTLEYLGGSQTQEVVAVGIRTAAHNVYFEVRVTQGTWNADHVNQLALGYTGSVEDAFKHPHVIDGYWIQIPNNAGELLDNIVYTVESETGNSTAQLTVPYSALATPATDDRIAALYDTLNAIEGL